MSTDTIEAGPITALAPWFGAKRNLAPQVVEAIGKHSAYWEPFCGSLAVLLAKPVAVMETVNDLHGELINLCRVIADEDLAVSLFARLSRLVFHEDLFHEAAQRWKARGYVPAGDVGDLDRAADFMTCSWFGRNGVAGTQSYNQGFSVRYTKNGGHAAKRWASVVESIPAWHARLQRVTILNRDAFELLEKVEDAEGVAIYCDPPYLVKGAKYVHDFAPGDHARLSELLARFRRTRVVVSYYEHPDLAALYPADRWHKTKIEVTKSLVNQGQRDSESAAVKAIEVLLTNDAHRKPSRFSGPTLFQE